MPSLIGVTVLALAAQASGDERGRMSVAAITVFQGMLRQAAAGQADKLQLSLGFLGPVLAEHERAFGAARSRGVVDRIRAAADRSAQEAAVRELIARDVVVLLRRIEGATAERSGTWGRTAALEWRLIEAAALARDLRRSQAVAGGLRDLVAAIDAEDLAAARQHAARIEKDLLELFPGG